MLDTELGFNKCQLYSVTAPLSLSFLTVYQEKQGHFHYGNELVDLKKASAAGLAYVRYLGDASPDIKWPPVLALVEWKCLTLDGF